MGISELEEAYVPCVEAVFKLEGPKQEITRREWSEVASKITKWSDSGGINPWIGIYKCDEDLRVTNFGVDNVIRKRLYVRLQLPWILQLRLIRGSLKSTSPFMTKFGIPKGGS